MACRLHEQHKFIETFSVLLTRDYVVHHKIRATWTFLLLGGSVIRLSKSVFEQKRKKRKRTQKNGQNHIFVRIGKTHIKHVDENWERQRDKKAPRMKAYTQQSSWAGHSFWLCSTQDKLWFEHRLSFSAQNPDEHISRWSNFGRITTSYFKWPIEILWE